MFGWRKKNDGFVWNEYVRTTILLRREQRKQRIENVRDAAVGGIKEASRQGVALGVAGASAAGRGLWSGVQASAAVIADWVIVIAAACWLWLAGRAQPLTESLSYAASRTGAALNSPDAARPLLLVAAAAALFSVLRWQSSSFDSFAALAAVIALVSLLCAGLPWAMSHGLGAWAASAAGAIPYVDRLQPSPAASASLATAAGIGAMLALGFAALSWLGPALMSNSSGDAATAPAAPALTPATGRLEGKAVAIASDQLRLGGETVHLFGVEAPSFGQSCSQGKSCAAAAKAALQKLVAGKRVVCDVSSRRGSNASIATCQINEADIAGQLVRGGHLFATTGLFATYASAEREARANKVGVWRSSALRPAEFRAKMWDDAKQASPSGCPIKGSIAGDTKTYHLPWGPAYAKAKVRAERGERWFCTEAEAQAAGWKPGEPS